MSLKALGHDQPAVPSEDIEEREEEEVPLRRKRSVYRRARTEFNTSAFAQFHAPLSADVLPQTAISESAGPFVTANKGKAPMPELDILAKFLAEDAQARQCLEEEQASERLVQRLRAEDLAKEDLPNVSEERAKELDDLMMRMTEKNKKKKIKKETDWLNLMMQVGSNPALARGVFMSDVTEGGEPDAQSEVTQMMRNLVKNQWCAAHNGIITMKVVKAMSKQQLIEEYDHRLILPASTQHAEDPESAGVVLLNLLFGYSLWLCFGCSPICSGTLGTDVTAFTVPTSASKDSAGSPPLRRARCASGAEIVDPRLRLETVAEYASSPPRSRRKRRGVRSDDFFWDKPVEDFFSSESGSDDDMETYIPPLPYGAFKDWEIAHSSTLILYGMLLSGNCLFRQFNAGLRRNPTECLASVPIACTARQMVFSSPWLIANKESWLTMQNGFGVVRLKSVDGCQKMAPKRATRSTPVTTTPAPTATTTTSVTNAQLQAMIDQGVTAALAARDANRNGDDSHTSGTGGRRTERVVRECTYQDFMKCKPLYFKGTEGVVELTQWFERMETVFRISNCSVENQIKFSTCTLLAGALTWWNSHVLTVSHDVAYAMTWADLRKKMTDKYCPRNEMKKLEAELWNLKVKGTDVIGYNQRFQELALLCVRMFPEESDKIERYVGGLPDMIHGNIVASKPKTMQEAVEMATELMDKKVITIAERQAENKRKFENTSRNNQNQQQQNKRQNTGRAYTTGTGEKKPYGDLNPYAQNAIITTMVHVLLNATNATKLVILPVTVGVREMPTMLTIRGVLGQARNLLALSVEFKDTSRGNVQRTNPDSNVVTGTFLLNNCYVSILFNTGADRSFVSTAFSSQMDITPSTLDHYYDVKLADGRIIRLNTILKFRPIIGMDWLARYQAIIVCAEKIVHIPWGNETLIFHGDGSNQGYEARLHIISYSKTQEYMLKGCLVFLEHVTTKEVEDKLEKKRLEDVPIVRYFPEMFPEDLLGLPPTRQVEFQIDLVPGAAPVAWHLID
ncbi:putative reverse transcriptase domain-containing protein [Tanacetum coccineum]